MAALDRNGIYKEMKEGELTIIDSTSDLGINLSNEELEILEYGLVSIYLLITKLVIIFAITLKNLFLK